MDATVTAVDVRDVGPDTVVIEFESPAGFDGRPGQFVKLGAVVDDGRLRPPSEDAESDDDEAYARFYTLSSPDSDETFEVTVGFDPAEAGSFSRHLVEMAAGAELAMTGPFGDDYYEGESRAVVLAGGPGIGPAVGIGERAVADGNEVAVVYRDDAPAHEERLDALRESGASVVVTDDDVGPHVAAALTGGSDEQVFVYGFADFVEAALAAVDEAGGDPDDAKVENFG